MNNTAKTFSDKWNNNQAFIFNETIREGSHIFQWILNRNGFQSSAELTQFLHDKKRILDAGCGNGRITALLRKYSDELKTQVVGVDLVSRSIAQKNIELCGLDKNVHFYEKDLLGDLSDLGMFDFIYCQEVLHHLEDPKMGFLNLCKMLLPNGEIAIYVYKLKAPAREFVDDFIRQRVSNLTYEETMYHMNQITEFGRQLSNYGISIQVPDVELLGIKAGEYDLQRFIYHHFMKCFWNNGCTFQENSVVNYDWYHPENCSRYTIEQIREWFNEASLKINHEYVDHYGITMRGKKIEE